MAALETQPPTLIHTQWPSHRRLQGGKVSPCVQISPLSLTAEGVQVRP